MQFIQIKKQSLIDMVIDYHMLSDALTRAKEDFFEMWAMCETQKEAVGFAEDIDFFIESFSAEVAEISSDLSDKLIAYPHRASVFKFD